MSARSSPYYGDMVANIYQEAVRMHSRAFRSTPEGAPIARRKDGGYLCCGYCGTGWEAETGACVACGAPAASALKDYLDMLKDDYDNRPYVSANLGGMLLSSDGNFNMCSTDLYLGTNMMPIHYVMGDTG